MKVIKKRELYACSQGDFVGKTFVVINVEGQTVTDSSLTGSFAKINVQQLKTFVGDVARVKIFRKSRNDVSDYLLEWENFGNSQNRGTLLIRNISQASQNDFVVFTVKGSAGTGVTNSV